MSNVREKERGGGDKQKNERDKKRGDCFESCRSVRIESQAATAVHSDSALPLNITDTEMD